MAGPVAVRGVRDGRDEAPALGIEQRLRLGLTAGCRSGVPGTGDPGTTVALGGEQGVHRGRGGVQVVVEQAGQRRMPLLFAVVAVSEVAS